MNKFNVGDVIIPNEKYEIEFPEFFYTTPIIILAEKDLCFYIFDNNNGYPRQLRLSYFKLVDVYEKG